MYATDGLNIALYDSRTVFLKSIVHPVTQEDENSTGIVQKVKQNCAILWP
jgi:hypothetical protein